MLTSRLAAAAAATSLLLVLLAPAGAQAVSVAPAATHYSSCAQMHRHWSGGIAKKGVTKNVVHHADGTTTRKKLKGTVKHSNALYRANRKLDKDKDGIACEKG